MKKIFTIFVVLLSTLVFAQSVNPSLDGRAIVADSGIFPPGGYYGKAPGYLPGDTVVVTNHSTGFTLNVMILSSYDASEGIAIMLSPEAAEKLQITKGRDVYVKVQKKQSILYENTLETAKNKSVQKNIQELDPDKNPLVLPGNTEQKIREVSVKEVDETEFEEISPVEEIVEEVVVEEVQPEVAEIEEVVPVEEVVVEEVQPEVAEIKEVVPVEDVTLEETQPVVTEDLLDEEIIEEIEDEQIVIEDIPQEEVNKEIVETTENTEKVEVVEQPEETVTETVVEPVTEEAILDDYQETEVVDEEIIEPVIEVVETPVVEPIIEPVEEIAEAPVIVPIEESDTEVVQDEPEVAILTEEVEVTQEPILEETEPVYPEEIVELDDQIPEDFTNDETIEVVVEEEIAEPIIEEEKDIVELADSEGEEVYDDVIPSEIVEAEEIEEKEELADIDDMYENGIDEQIVFDALGNDDSEFVRTSFGESENLGEVESEITEEVPPQEELAEIDDTVNPEESDEEIYTVEVILPEEPIEEVATIEEQPVIEPTEEVVIEEAKIEDAKDIFSQITGDEVVLVPAEETEIEIPTEAEIIVEQPTEEIIPVEPEEKEEIVIELDKKENEVVISTANTKFSEKYSKNFVSDMKSLKKTKQTKSKTYYIQIATMSNEDNVANVIEKYGKTYSIYLIQQKNKSYQVLVGPLNDDEYELVLARFKRNYKDAFLRVIK